MAEPKTSNGKLIAGIVLMLLSFAALAVGIIGITRLTTTTDMIMYIVGLGGFLILEWLAHFLINKQHDTVGKSVASKIFWGITLVPYWILNWLIYCIGILVIGIINCICSLLGRDKLPMPNSTKKKQFYIIEDERYEKRQLVEYDRYGGCRYYQDDLGNKWMSKDEGKTFTRS